MRFSPLPVNHSAFRAIDTPQKAYLLGLLLADGTVMNPRPGICRSVVNLKILAGDIQACRLAQEIVGGNLRPCERGYRVIWEVNSDAIAADLIALGVTPRKTFTASLQWDLIPAHLHGAALAGLIDGDGNLRFDRVKRRAEVSIASGSAALRDQLLERFPFFKAVAIQPKGRRKAPLYRIEVQNHRERLRALLQTVYASLPFRVLERKQVVVDRLRGYVADQDSYDERMGHVTALKASGLTIAEIAAQVGTSARPILERLKAQGIDSRRVVFTEDDRQEMRRLHEQGMTVLQIHNAIGKGTEQAVRFYLQSIGCIKKVSKPTSRHPKTGEIIARHREGLSLAGISEKVDLGVVVVSRVLRQEGISLRKGSPLKLTPEGIAWAEIELQKGRTITSIAETLGVSTTLIRTRLKGREGSRLSG